MNNSVQGAASAAIIRLTAAQGDELRFLLDRHSGGGRDNVGPFQPRTIRARTCDEARKATLELVRLIKDRGPLTKRIYLKDGCVANDSKDCRMSRGVMERLPLADWRDFAKHIEATPRNVAYALGALRDDLPDSIPLVEKGKPTPGAAARTNQTIFYRELPTSPYSISTLKECRPPSSSVSTIAAASSLRWRVYARDYEKQATSAASRQARASTIGALARNIISPTASTSICW